MAASKAQGRSFGWFLLGTTVLSGGVATIGTGIGKALLVIGAGILLASLAGFLRIKPLEGDSPMKPTPEAMKWVGAGVALSGWFLTMGGLRFVDGNGGRIAVALVGIACSLFGILYLLPATFNKTVFWKTPAASARRSAVASGEVVEMAAPAAMGSIR